MKNHCKEILQTKGMERVTVDELIEETTPQARGEYVYIFFVLYIYNVIFVEILFLKEKESVSPTVTHFYT